MTYTIKQVNKYQNGNIVLTLADNSLIFLQWRFQHKTGNNKLICYLQRPRQASEVIPATDQLKRYDLSFRSVKQA